MQAGEGNRVRGPAESQTRRGRGASGDTSSRRARCCRGVGSPLVPATVPIVNKRRGKNRCGDPAYFLSSVGQLLIKVSGALLSSGALLMRKRPSLVTS